MHICWQSYEQARQLQKSNVGRSTYSGDREYDISEPGYKRIEHTKEQVMNEKKLLNL